MSCGITTIKLGSPAEDEAAQKNHQIQFIPATIEHNGPADINTYFTSFIKDREDKKLEGSLRGRPLDGEVVQVPKGSELLVLQAGQGDGLGGERNEAKVLRVIKRTNQFSYWNYDRAPSNQDNLQQALQWTELAEVLHSDNPKK